MFFKNISTLRLVFCKSETGMTGKRSRHRDSDDEEWVPSDDEGRRNKREKRDNERRNDRNNDKRDRDGRRVRRDHKDSKDGDAIYVIVPPRPYNPPPPPKKKSLRERLREQIEKANFPPAVKELAYSRMSELNSDGQKAINWIEGLCKIPFGKNDPLPVTLDSSKEEVLGYFEKVQQTLDDAVYGMKKVKEEVVNFVAQAISTNGTSIPRVLALAGSPGVGKTAIVRRGFAEALGRKMKCISMGGIRDSSHFVGFDYTYQGSRCGIIAQSLMDCGVNNPILYFDELDKVSLSQDGIEVQNLLIHLTDPVQNHAFQDKYFAGVEIDLSKVIIVFSYNDENLVHPVLKDRIHTIQVPSPTTEEKVVIAQKFLLKEHLKNLHLQEGDIILPKEVAKHIITRYCEGQQGVRHLKRCLETIVLKINTARFLGTKQKYKCFQNPAQLRFPMELTVDMCDQLIDQEKKEDKYLHTMYM